MKDIIIDYDGMTIIAPEANSVPWMLEEIFVNNCYQSDTVQIEKEDVIVDLGANVGTFLMYASRYSDGPFIGVEPDPDNWRCLNINIINDKKLSRIARARHAAVMDKKGRDKLYIDGHGSPLMFDHNIAGKLDKYVDVETITIQELIDDPRYGISADKSVLLKMDIEGAEGIILNSITDETLRMFRKIVMEYHDNVSPLSGAQITDRFKGAGYEVESDKRVPFGTIHALRID